MVRTSTKSVEYTLSRAIYNRYQILKLMKPFSLFDNRVRGSKDFGEKA